MLLLLTYRLGDGYCDDGTDIEDGGLDCTPHHIPTLPDALRRLVYRRVLVQSTATYSSATTATVEMSATSLRAHPASAYDMLRACVPYLLWGARGPGTICRGVIAANVYLACGASADRNSGI